MDPPTHFSILTFSSPGVRQQLIEFARGDNNVGDCGSLVEDVPLGARMLVAMAKANRAGRR